MTASVRDAVADTAVRDGVAMLGPEATRLLAALDAVFLDWAHRAGALPMTPPPLLEVADLAGFAVLRNFPHLVMAAAALHPRLAGSHDSEIEQEIPTELMRPAARALPTAVCYGLYPWFRDKAIAEPTTVTAAGVCFRNEQQREPGLRRLDAFHMREVVVLGTPEQVRGRLDHFSGLLARFAGQLNLPVSNVAATDPFFRPDSTPAQWQRLQPSKHEFRCGQLAIASVNEHRKFFGEACRIVGQRSGAIVSTGCVGMGLERWIDLLVRRYHGDFTKICAAVARAAAACVDLSEEELS